MSARGVLNRGVSFRVRSAAIFVMRRHRQRRG